METEKVGHQQNPCNEIRIVLLGKTGVGKSATGNTILGKELFHCSFSASSVTKVCCKATNNFNGTKVSVIDTPGLFDPNFTIEEMVDRIKLCIPLSAPGPHVFLLVLQPGRFTKEDRDTMEIFLQIFGEDASRHAMVLFTHKNMFRDETVQEFVSKNPDLERFFNKCKKQYHVFNNEVKDTMQVDQLFKKINKLISENGGGCYSNEMLLKTERAIEEEKQRILRENQEQRCKEWEELKVKFKAEYLNHARDELWERQEREAREKAEDNNKYIHMIVEFLFATLKRFVINKLEQYQ